MERAGLRVQIVRSENIRQTLEAISEVSRAIGEEARGASLVKEIRSRLDALSRRYADRPRVRALFCLQVEPIVAAGSGTLPSELLEAAGGENVVDDERYPRMGIEAVIALGPEVILQSRMDVPAGSDDDPVAAYWSRWPDVPAVRSGRVRLLEDSKALRPGPRIADAAEEIARLLHDGEDTETGR
jgi:iron complex transport system substrate-binding protein